MHCSLWLGTMLKEWDLTPSLRAQIAGVIRVEMYGNMVCVFTTLEVERPALHRYREGSSKGDSQAVSCFQPQCPSNPGAAWLFSTGRYVRVGRKEWHHGRTAFKKNNDNAITNSIDT